MLDFEGWLAGVAGMLGISAGVLGTTLVLVLVCGRPEAEGGMEQTSRVGAMATVASPEVLVSEAEQPVATVACWPRDVVGEMQRPVGGCGEVATIAIPWVLPVLLRRRREDEPDLGGPIVQTPEVFVVRRELPDGQVMWVTDYDIRTMEVSFSTSPSRAKAFRGPAWAKFWRDQGDDLIAAEIGGVA